MRRAAAVAIIGGLLGGALVVGLGTGGAGAGSPGTSVTTEIPVEVVSADVSPSSARPGETFTVTMIGCVGGDVVAGLWVPFAADPVVSTGPIPSTGAAVVGTLTIPLGAAPTDAHVVVFCSLDPAASVAIPVQILAATTTTAPAAAVGGAPAFTG